MLQLGRPQIEYICPYGHGKLNIEEIQITGKTTPAWTEHGDLWEELFAASKDSDSEALKLPLWRLIAAILVLAAMGACSCGAGPGLRRGLSAPPIHSIARTRVERRHCSGRDSSNRRARSGPPTRSSCSTRRHPDLTRERQDRAASEIRCPNGLPPLSGGPPLSPRRYQSLTWFGRLVERHQNTPPALIWLGAGQLLPIICVHGLIPSAAVASLNAVEVAGVWAR